MDISALLFKLPSSFSPAHFPHLLFHFLQTPLSSEHGNKLLSISVSFSSTVPSSSTTSTGDCLLLRQLLLLLLSSAGLAATALHFSFSPPTSEQQLLHPLHVRSDSSLVLLDPIQRLLRCKQQLNLPLLGETRRHFSRLDWSGRQQNSPPPLQIPLHVSQLLSCNFSAFSADFSKLNFSFLVLHSPVSRPQQSNTRQFCNFNFFFSASCNTRQSRQHPLCSADLFSNFQQPSSSSSSTRRTAFPLHSPLQMPLPTARIPGQQSRTRPAAFQGTQGN